MYQEECPEHNTPLYATKISSKCQACYKDGHANQQGYKCEFCDFYVHEECINPNIPSRHKHPLKLTSCYRGSQSCCLCEGYLALLYQCSQCIFRICIKCTRKPLIVNHDKAHKHELHQVPMKLSFTCDACGSCSSDYPCICHQCCFIVHRKCIYLPRVIYINRHNHRISHVSSLGPSKWICGVCREPVNGECGAYSCFTCPYAVHSLCAIHYNIWDRRELEGIPEEEEGKPFEVIDENLIKHFSHQHNLKVSLGHEEDKHCYACTLPLNSERCYRCTQCDFMLDNKCANLPLRKRHPIFSRELTLQANVDLFQCGACGRYCTGFSYSSKNLINIDVKCASITDAFKHESHPHLLFPFTSDIIDRSCNICDSSDWMRVQLRCIYQDDCGGFTLCFRCATLPTEVKHKYDDHPLSLCYAEGNVNSTYCCGVCEEEIYPKSGFYSCSECDSTLHTKCVYKNLLHPRPGYSLMIRYMSFYDLLPNNSLSRPTCQSCKTRCSGNLVLNFTTDTSIFICSSCGLPDMPLLIVRYSKISL